MKYEATTAINTWNTTTKQQQQQKLQKFIEKPFLQIQLLNNCNRRLNNFFCLTPYLRWPESRYYGSREVNVGPCNEEVAQGGGDEDGIDKSIHTLMTQHTAHR